MNARIDEMEVQIKSEGLENSDFGFRVRDEKSARCWI